MDVVPVKQSVEQIASVLLLLSEGLERLSQAALITDTWELGQATTTALEALLKAVSEASYARQLFFRLRQQAEAYWSEKRP